MQGVIYGLRTDQTVRDPSLRTRLDIDEWFGTVINRYVAQAVIGLPLTLYGSGEQTRGFIALEDAMQCMTRLIGAPPLPGQYSVVNQMSGHYKLRTLAEKVAKIAQKEFRIPVKIQRVENPRVEADIHPYEPIHERLQNNFGFNPVVSPEEAIFSMLESLTQPEMKARIEEKQHLIIPRTWWSGIKKKVDQLEIIEGIEATD
jgi:UDP-sulfoquinovose synthase